MRLPVEWITEYAPVTAGPEELAERLTMAGLEVEEIAAGEEAGLGAVLDIKVTPNRGDCLSVVGVAREIAAAYDVRMKPSPAAVSSAPGGAAELTSVVIEDEDLCPRYADRIIRNAKWKAAPQWMQQRLTAAGMRPLGGIVDVTNYVMLEMGQPLHAFDYETLAEHRIVVRRARAGETIQTLDGSERALTPEMLAICDAEKPVAIAGIMGGARTEVKIRTKTVLLESAHFHALSVRRTARALGMRTEASYRFERVVDPAGVVAAADRACELIAQLGLGEVVDGVIDAYPLPAAPRRIEVRPSRVSLMLGYQVAPGEVAAALVRLGFEAHGSPAGGQGDRGTGGSHPLTVAVPSWRPDIVREADLVEETGRVLGYERIPEMLPAGRSTQGMDSPAARLAEQVRDVLVGAGLQEIISHSLLAHGPYEPEHDVQTRVGIRSALSAELSGLRRSLLPGLVDAMERNARRGQSPLAFFEVGKLFRRAGDEFTELPAVGGLICGPLASRGWQRDGAPAAAADFYTAAGLVDRLADALGIAGVELGPISDSRLHPGRSASIVFGGRPIGFVGELHPELARDLTVRARPVAFELTLEAVGVAASIGRGFTPLAPYPAVARDLAPRVDVATPFSALRDAIDGAGIAILERYELTDLFTGSPLPEGVKSLTLSFTFRSPDRTLTDEEVAAALARLRAALEAQCGATFAA